MFLQKFFFFLSGFKLDAGQSQMSLEERHASWKYASASVSVSGVKVSLSSEAIRREKTIIVSALSTTQMDY